MIHGGIYWFYQCRSTCSNQQYMAPYIHVIWQCKLVEYGYYFKAWTRESLERSVWNDQWFFRNIYLKTVRFIEIRSNFTFTTISLFSCLQINCKPPTFHSRRVSYNSAWGLSAERWCRFPRPWNDSKIGNFLFFPGRCKSRNEAEVQVATRQSLWPLWTLDWSVVCRSHDVIFFIASESDRRTLAILS